MRNEAVACVCALVLIAGCNQSTTLPDDAASGMDGGAGTDTGVRVDGGGDVGSAGDTGGAIDVGTDASAAPDAGDVDASLPFGCDPTTGVDCDADYVGRCTPACAATECCSPQHGTFTCVARNADGTCPLPDIFVDETRIEGQYAVEYAYFAADDCAIAEGCVDAPGLRRLLRWDTWTPNQGEADMFLGRTPARGVSSGPYVWSACHMHHHFETYADYQLLRGDGSEAAHGHKQAFCLLDYHHYPCGGAGEPTCRYPDPAAVYTCGNQGIERDWQDVYERNLDCQWIDVTDVAPGDYTLHIALNTHHLIPESDYANNDAFVSVTIPVPPPDNDVTMACAMPTSGPDRDCGLTRSSDPGVGTCTPGASVTVGCSAACGLGSCSGDTVLRVCDTSHDPTCTARQALATNDDSGCPTTSGRCRRGDCCSQVTFTCPASGTYAAFWGAYDSGGTATCTLAAM